MSVGGFDYAQARLQARHGQRPDERLWRRLEGIGELSHYLQVARRSVLQRWVAGLQPGQSSHAIELSLRRQLRGYVDEVAGWLPEHWRAPLGWAKRLSDLAAIQHLLSEDAMPAWMSADPALAPFTAGTLAERRKAMHNSDCACLVQHWTPSVRMHLTWMQCWEQMWPHSPRLTAGLRRLGALQATQGAAALAGVTDVSGQQRAALQGEYERVFRYHTFQPAAAFAHLALVALDTQRLRGAILRRLLFDETGEAGS
jgi:hypothetical protein